MQFDASEGRFWKNKGSFTQTRMHRHAHTLASPYMKQRERKHIYSKNITP